MLLGSVVATILVIVVTVQIALDTSYWTIINHFMVWGSLIWYFILDYFYNFVIGGSYVGSLTMVSFSRDSSKKVNDIKHFSNWPFSQFSGNVGANVLVHGGDIVHHARHSGVIVALLLHRCAADSVGPRAAEAAGRPNALAPEPGHIAHAVDKAHAPLPPLGLRVRPSGGLRPADHVRQDNAQIAERLGLQVRHALRLEQRF